MRFRSLLVAAAPWVALCAIATADPSAPSSASIYNLDAKWTTQDGADVALASFAGKPLVVAMGYTTCRDICPAVVADMMWIEKHLPPDAADRVRFAFFTFDPEADTPERLRLYAESHGLEHFHYWRRYPEFAR